MIIQKKEHKCTGCHTNCFGECQHKGRETIVDVLVCDECQEEQEVLFYSELDLGEYCSECILNHIHRIEL